MGPIKTQSEGVASLLRSPMTSVHVVTLLEEMPVQESLDAIAELTSLGIPIGKIIVNAARPPLLTEGRITKTELRRGLAVAGLPVDAVTVAGLQSEARAHLTRRELEESLRAELAELGRPVVELPLLPEGVDREALNTLAGCLLGDR
jgi:hypothetical protein